MKQKGSHPGNKHSASYKSCSTALLRSLLSEIWKLSLIGCGHSQAGSTQRMMQRSCDGSWEWANSEERFFVNFGLEQCWSERVRSHGFQVNGCANPNAAGSRDVHDSVDAFHVAAGWTASFLLEQSGSAEAHHYHYLDGAYLCRDVFLRPGANSRQRDFFHFSGVDQRVLWSSCPWFYSSLMLSACFSFFFSTFFDFFDFFVNFFELHSWYSMAYGRDGFASTSLEFCHFFDHKSYISSLITVWILS